MKATTDNIGSCILHVCTSCRISGAPREPKEDRQGFILYKKISEAIRDNDLQDRVELRPAECLSICPRPCGIALSSAGAWTYLFGDQEPNKTVQEILDCLKLYLKTSDGFMVRGLRPKALRSSILGRVPPITREETCI